MSHDSGREAAGGADLVARALLAHAETGLIALDRRLRVTLVNEAALRMLGAEAGAATTLVTLLDRSAALTKLGIETLLTWLQGDGTSETMLRRHDGRQVEVHGAAGPDGHVLLSLSLQPRSSLPAARRDALTGLADRAWFDQRLGELLAEAGAQPAVLLIDLDRFKSVNDTLGHPAGDALLQVVAKRLVHALRDGDVICRLSGDEFAVIMPQVTDPVAVGRRLVGALGRPYTVLGETATIGASIGIATAPAHGLDADGLLRAADVALYAAKGERGGVRLFDAALNLASERRRSMCEMLRRAIAAEQLVLHYQPQIALDRPTLSGFEALVRWRHPVEGLLLPGQFLPLAEETGLIWTIGDWVLRTACEEATGWPPHLRVAVNVSIKQLLDRRRLARTIKTVLLQTALAPERLEIEISEEALTREAETLPVLQAIRALGVRISLDDFGTGSASLRQLGYFPLDKLKIDRSFVHGLGSNEAAAALVRAIVGVGRSLGVTTIAEGVETEEQRNWLRNDGCGAMQGYLVSRPVPASDVPGIISAMEAQSERAA